MARSKFGVGHIFLLTVLVALVLIVRSSLRPSGPIPSQHLGQRRGRVFPPESDRRDQNRESRRSEPRKETPAACGAGTSCDSRYFRPWAEPVDGTCGFRIINDYPVPDPRCRYFKIKDRVENYLAEEVRSGRLPLDAAQRGIASDWTQYLQAANAYCEAGKRC